MKLIGAHVETRGGLFNAPKNASAIGATAFALFTKNPRQWASPPLDSEQISAFKNALREYGYEPHVVVPHEGYLINMGSADPDKREKAFESFVGELKRCEELGLPMLNIHPGAHPGEKEHGEAIERIAHGINRAMGVTESVKIVLENTAGQGTSVGGAFEDLAGIIALVKEQNRLGVCLDTCHAFSAGFDIRTKKGYEAFMSSFDALVGLKYLCALHLNDAKGELGKKLDRHESIGKGSIGLPLFKAIMQDPRLDAVPLILETPDPSIWKEEIALLKSFDK